MKEYMMIFRNEKFADDQIHSGEQMQAGMKHWQSWSAGLAQQGKYAGTNRLSPEGKTIGTGKVVSDGPFVEVKEMVGGCLIVKATSLDEAVEIAQSCPNLVYGGNVEVR